MPLSLQKVAKLRKCNLYEVMFPRTADKETKRYIANTASEKCAYFTVFYNDQNCIVYIEGTIHGHQSASSHRIFL